MKWYEKEKTGLGEELFRSLNTFIIPRKSIPKVAIPVTLLFIAYASTGKLGWKAKYLKEVNNEEVTIRF